MGSPDRRVKRRLRESVQGFRSPLSRRKCLTVVGERVKGEKTVSPFTIPAVPQRNRCCALRSPPGPQPAVGTRPIPGTRPYGASASAVQNCSRQFCRVSIRLCPPSLAASPCLRSSGSPISAGARALLHDTLFQKHIRSGMKISRRRRCRACPGYGLPAICGPVARLSAAQAGKKPQQYHVAAYSPGCGVNALPGLRVIGNMQYCSPDRRGPPTSGGGPTRAAAGTARIAKE